MSSPAVFWEMVSVEWRHRGWAADLPEPFPPMSRLRGAERGVLARRQGGGPRTHPSAPRRSRCGGRGRTAGSTCLPETLRVC